MGVITTRRSVNKDTSPEDVHRSENAPLLSSPSQRRSPDGFPRLLGNDQERGPRPNLGSEFWCHGVSNLRWLGSGSNGNRKVSGSTARIEEPGIPPTDKDIAESVPTSSRDQLHRSLEIDGTSTSSSGGADHQARASGSPLALDSPLKASGSLVGASGSPVEASGSPAGASGSPVVSGSLVGATGPPAKGTRSPAEVSYLESHCPSPQKSKETLAPDVGTHEQLVDIEAQKRLIVPANAPNLSTESCAGEKHDSLVYDDATSMHAGREEGTPTFYLEIEENLQGPPNTGNPKAAGSIRSASEKAANPGTGWRSGQKVAESQRHLPTRPEPSQLPEDKKSSSGAKATSHLSQPLLFTPPTGPKSHRVQHLKSLSAEASKFHPRRPPSIPTTPTSTYGNGHRRSASMGMRQSNPSSSSAMPTRPLGQHSVGTPSFSITSGRFQNPGAPRSLTGPHFPVPRQHTPQEQGQYFATSGSTSLQMATQVQQPFDGNMSPLPSTTLFSPMHPSPMHPSPMHPSDSRATRNNAHVDGQDEHNVEYSQPNHFDSYGTSQAASAAPNASEPQQNGNIYTQDTNGYGPAYYSNHTDPTHPVDFCPLLIDYPGLIKI